MISIVDWSARLVERLTVRLRRRPRFERRKWPRTELSSSLTILASQNQSYRGICRDVSVAGLGAIVYGELRIDAPVGLTFDTGRQKYVNARAVVRNRYGSRYGFEFLREAD